MIPVIRYGLYHIVVDKNFVTNSSVTKTDIKSISVWNELPEISLIKLQNIRMAYKSFK